MFLTNSSTGDVDWEGVRLGDFGSAVEVALAGKTTLSGLQTRWAYSSLGEKEGAGFFVFSLAHVFVCACVRACVRVCVCTSHDVCCASMIFFVCACFSLAHVLVCACVSHDVVCCASMIFFVLSVHDFFCLSVPRSGHSTVHNTVPLHYVPIHKQPFRLNINIQTILRFTSSVVCAKYFCLAGGGLIDCGTLSQNIKTVCILIGNV